MFSYFQKSNFVKRIAFLLVFSMLTMSFQMRTDDGGVIRLSAGTMIALETISVIQSDLIFPGQIVDFRVKYDVKVNDKVVIMGGSLAKGQVLRVTKAKGIGQAGFLEIQLKSVTAVDGQEIFLTGGNIYNEGDDKMVLSIVLGVAVCLLFLLLKGKNAVLPAGYQVSTSVAVTTDIKVQ